METLTHEQQRAVVAVVEGKNVFLLGDAGTGKSHVISTTISELEKRGVEIVVAATTWAAALILQCPGASSIHRAFGLGLADKPASYYIAFTRRMLAWHTDVLILDEVSMLSRELFELMDTCARAIRGVREKPFGGMRLLFVGDPKQLSPVKGESFILSPLFDKCFGGPDGVVTLTRNFRQRADKTYAELLSRIGRGTTTGEDMALLRTRLVQDYEANVDDNIPRLFSLKRDADVLNDKMLKQLDGPSQIYEATVSCIGRISGSARQGLMDTCLSNARIPKKMTLKVGARVVLVKTIDDTRGWVNSTLASVIHLDKTTVVLFKGDGIPSPKESDWYESEYRWISVKEKIEEFKTKKPLITVSVFGLPIKLAWGITIHKSQGMGFDKAVADLGKTFTHGQVYVGLGRVRTLDGLILKSMPKSIHYDECLMDAYRSIEARGMEHSNKKRKLSI